VFSAIRSGDYYLFEEFNEDDDLDISVKNECKSDEDIKQLTVGKVYACIIASEFFLFWFSWIGIHINQVLFWFIANNHIYVFIDSNYCELRVVI
jgi:hypothetical protein